jgi:hypothetical protein
MKEKGDEKVKEGGIKQELCSIKKSTKKLRNKG